MYETIIEKYNKSAKKQVLPKSQMDTNIVQTLILLQIILAHGDSGL